MLQLIKFLAPSVITKNIFRRPLPDSSCTFVEYTLEKISSTIWPFPFFISFFLFLKNLLWGNTGAACTGQNARENLILKVDIFLFLMVNKNIIVLKKHGKHILIIFSSSE